MERPKYLTRLKQITELTAQEQSQLQPVTDKFVFRSNEYYQKLINWDDPDDPIRRLIMPHLDELRNFGKLDASDEQSYTKVPGLEHKYPSTALLICNDVCAGYCRYCFRKRLFINRSDEAAKDVSQGLEYIRAHEEITNVLLTGGDPLLLSTNRLARILEGVFAIPHVKILRIGTKLPAFNPHQILNNKGLFKLLRRFRGVDRQVYIMAHFDHPRELTPIAIEAVRSLQRAGATVVNQHPVIRGVNDNPDILCELWDTLAANGVAPYYVFQCRPTSGNKPYVTTIEETLSMVEAARARASGLSKRIRYVISHSTGKVEPVAMTEKLIVFRYHNAANPEDEGRTMIYGRNREATWLDDYTMVIATHVMTDDLAADLAA